MKNACLALAAIAVVACSDRGKVSPRTDDSDTPAAAQTASPASGPDAERVVLQTHLQKAALETWRPRDREQARLHDGAEFGMIGLLNTGAGGDPDAPTAPWGRDDTLGNDPMGARGNLWGDEIGDKFGAGGLGLRASGESGGRGEGIGLGSIGTLGHGAGTGGGGGGSGRLGGAHREKPPQVRMGATSVSGRLPPEVIQRIVRQNFGRFRLCYENALRNTPTLEGSVTVSFTIKEDGSVDDVAGKGDIPDSGVVSCVTRAFNGLSFPQPEGGVVRVTYPIKFSPGESAATTKLTLGGKALADATADDLEAALEKAGCTDVVRQERAAGASGPTVFTAKKDGRSLTVRFVASKETRLDDAQIAKLEETAAVQREGAFLVAVSFDGPADKAAARALLDAIILHA
jgi:hypothetical protein